MSDNADGVSFFSFLSRGGQRVSLPDFFFGLDEMHFFKTTSVIQYTILVELTNISCYLHSQHQLHPG